MKTLALFLSFICVTYNPRAYRTGDFAEVRFTRPVWLQSNFVLTTFEGRMLTILDINSARKLNSALRGSGTDFFQLGTGNAFSAKIGEQFFICTAGHVLVGQDSCRIDVGEDLSLLSYDCLLEDEEFLSKQTLDFGYEVDTVLARTDSVFVIGYIANELGKVKTVFIKGIGTIVEKDEFQFESQSNFEMNERQYLMKVPRNFDLKGLSGAPAFNRQGKVIGVYSGRARAKVEDGEEYYLRIALF